MIRPYYLVFYKNQKQTISNSFPLHKAQKTMEYQLAGIQNNVQDTSSEAWKHLGIYIQGLAESGGTEFAPREFLGEELFRAIHTLPASIASLKQVKKIELYGSHLMMLPPEIGDMEALEELDIYTSYDLHWLPYEITQCTQLDESRISTRALYGNYKFRNEFPDLSNNPVRYSGATVCCSVCKRESTYDAINQLWISQTIGTDVVPLLVNLCSSICQEQLPTSPEKYLPFPHKGGHKLIQPPDYFQLTNHPKKEIPLGRLKKFWKK